MVRVLQQFLQALLNANGRLAALESAPTRYCKKLYIHYFDHWSTKPFKKTEQSHINQTLNRNRFPPSLS